MTMVSACDRSGSGTYCSATATANCSANDCARYRAAPDLR
jgi:hypothetical protein